MIRSASGSIHERQTSLIHQKFGAVYIQTFIELHTILKGNGFDAIELHSNIWIFQKAKTVCLRAFRRFLRTNHWERNLEKKKIRRTKNKPKAFLFLNLVTCASNLVVLLEISIWVCAYALPTRLVVRRGCTGQTGGLLNSRSLLSPSRMWTREREFEYFDRPVCADCGSRSGLTIYRGEHTVGREREPYDSQGNVQENVHTKADLHFLPVAWMLAKLHFHSPWILSDSPIRKSTCWLLSWLTVRRFALFLLVCFDL